MKSFAKPSLQLKRHQKAYQVMISGHLYVKSFDKRPLSLKSHQKAYKAVILRHLDEELC
jgi:hypothetical protein